MRTPRMAPAILSISLALTVFAALGTPALAGPAYQAGDPAAQVHGQLADQGYTVRAVGLWTWPPPVRRHGAPPGVVEGWYALSHAYTDSRITTYPCGLPLGPVSDRARAAMARSETGHSL